MKKIGLAIVVAALFGILTAPSLVLASQSLTIGGQAVSINNDSAKFEEYKSVPRGPFLDNYSLSRDAGNWNLDFSADKVLRSDQSYALNMQGPVNFKLSWDQIPHNISNNAKNAYTQASSTTFTLPTALRTAIQGNSALYNSMMTAFVATAESVVLSTRRDKAAAEVAVAEGTPLNFDLAVERENKTGKVPFGTPFGFSQAVELPLPIDYQTTNLVLSKSASLIGLDFDATYKYSDFKNNNGSVQWDNPKRLTDTTAASSYVGGTASATGKLDLFPNNIAHEATVNMGSDLPLNGRFAGSVAFIRNTQNDAFLPYTTNTAIVPGAANAGTPPFDASQLSNLPATSLNGKIDTLAQHFFVNLNPSKVVRVDLKYSSANVDNKTTELTFPGHVRMDQVWEVTTPEAKAFDNKLNNYDLDVTLNLPSGWTLGTGYGIEVYDRNHREVHQTQENIIRSSLGGNFLFGTMLNASYLSGKRHMHDFHISDYTWSGGSSAGSLFERPGLRRSDVSDRDRTKYNIALNATPIDNVILGATYRNEKCGYSSSQGDLTGGNATFANTMYGLLKQDQDGVVLNADIWLFDNSLQASTYLDRSTTRYSERSNTSSSVAQLTANDWTIDTTDVYDTLGFELTRYLADDRFTAGVSYWISQGTGQIVAGNTAGTAVNPPNTFSQTSEIALKAEAKVTEDFSISWLAAYEQYVVDDFAIDNVGILSPSASPTTIYLGNSPQDYKAVKVQVASKIVY